MHFRLASFLRIQRKTNRQAMLLLFVLTPVYLNWPSYATVQCYRSPHQFIYTMQHGWFYISIHSFTIFEWNMRNLRLNLIYLSFFVQYISPMYEPGLCHIPYLSHNFGVSRTQPRVVLNIIPAFWNSWKFSIVPYNRSLQQHEWVSALYNVSLL